MTEGLIVFPIMLLAITAAIEFSYGMFQWNQAAKAMQLGVRKAIVSDPLTTDFATIFAFNPALGGTVVVPDATRVSRCGAGYAACNAAPMTRIVSYMQSFNSKITAANLRVTYQHNGLGYEGRPSGPVVTLRMELVGLPLDLPFIGKFISMSGITFPSFPVTATTEDLKTASGS